MDWKRKLTSRKLWAAIAGFVSMLMIYFGKPESEASQVASLILAGASVVAYIVGEGLIDAAREEAPIYLEEVKEGDADDIAE